MTDKEYEEGATETNKDRKSDQLEEYSDKAPMTSAKINAGEPTAVQRNSNDHKI